MKARAPDGNLQPRYAAAIRKVKLLSSLREVVALDPESDLLPRQWAAIEAPLQAIQYRLLALLENAGRRYLRELHVPAARRLLNAFLGKLETVLSRALNVFDTFVDIISQRHLPEVGILLRGCDVLAADSLRKNHPALATLERPLVYLNRGFGASTLRQGVTLSAHVNNPLQTIEIPYTKLREKQNLTSVIHEAGHAAMASLGLNVALPEVIGRGVAEAGAPRSLQHLFRLWTTEIGPDFWGFCNCGVAQACSVRDILSLDPHHVLSVSLTDPHPPPYLRVLLAFEFCRQQWGYGQWDKWNEDWIALYPLAEAAPRNQRILADGTRFLPVVARTLLRAPFAVLGQRPIPSLFDLDAVAPVKIDDRIRRALATGTLDLSGLTPCSQLAVFNGLKARGALEDVALDRLMTRWLAALPRLQTTASD